MSALNTSRASYRAELAHPLDWDQTIRLEFGNHQSVVTLTRRQARVLINGLLQVQDLQQEYLKLISIVDQYYIQLYIIISTAVVADSQAQTGRNSNSIHLSE